MVLIIKQNIFINSVNWGILMKKLKTLNNAEIASFCEQLSLLLPAGITPSEAIGLMLSDTVEKEGHTLLKQILDSLNEGCTFYEALCITNVFPEYVESMVLLGEESGDLDIIMDKLADYYSQQCCISESIKNAVSYPLVMICLMFFILIILLTKILPIFNQVFHQLGGELSGVAKQLMQIGSYIQSLSVLFVCLIGIIMVTILYFIFNTHGKKSAKHLLQSWTLTKGFYLDIAFGRFAGALSMIITSGVDTFKGISLSKGLVDNELMFTKITLCEEALKKGDSISEAVRAAGIFEAKHQRMLEIGIRSGNTDIVLKKISDYYEDKVQDRLYRILNAIEPTLVIIFSFTVGLILLSVIMPLIGIMESIG